MKFIPFCDATHEMMHLIEMLWLHAEVDSIRAQNEKNLTTVANPLHMTHN